MSLSELVSPNRVVLGLEVSSKKRLLERMGELLHEDQPELDVHTAFQSLFERERLGSTGIGRGVALPHGRMAGLTQAVGAFAVLHQPLDFESVDQQPVQMVFALLVPEEANETHLQILSQLARLFDRQDLREQLLRAQNREQLYETLTQPTQD
ncbi:MAG: PTS IIA-like nitrogen regulatory protein PtsN [Gammaproteobacteria bacterium]|nr:PTS IIA-like nitrogen regulatory protein PtsN [Gammaproteobacteria bacterium]